MSTETIHIPNLQDLISKIEPDSIISRKVYRDDALNVMIFGFAPGQELSEHTASMPATLHFLSGTAVVTLGDKEMTAVPGTWVHMPAHLPHSIVAQTEVTMLLQLVKASN